MPDDDDLSSRSLDELLAQRRRLDRAIREAAVRELALKPKPARAEAMELLFSFGLTLKDLRLGPPSALAGKKVPPKYQDPNNPANTWTGRGLQPRWFREALEAGTPAEAMAIRPR